MELESYMTPEEVARKFVVPLNRVHYWLRAGRLRGVKVGRAWRIPESALLSFLSTPAEAVNE
jgi:acetyl-CoA synthetase